VGLWITCPGNAQAALDAFAGLEVDPELPLLPEPLEDPLLEELGAVDEVDELPVSLELVDALSDFAAVFSLPFSLAPSDFVLPLRSDRLSLR
jgi:hypothetical protein